MRKPGRWRATILNMKSPVLPHHPLDHPDVTKIALSSAASEALAAMGPHCLVIAARADCTAPEWVQGRMILLCLPLDKESADAAVSVALDKARVVAVKPQPQSFCARFAGPPGAYPQA